MGEVRDRMEQDLFLRGVAANTRETYLRYAKQFVAFHRRDPRALDTRATWLVPRICHDELPSEGRQRECPPECQDGGRWFVRASRDDSFPLPSSRQGSETRRLMFPRARWLAMCATAAPASASG
jgi:hypothetical protein